MGILSDITSGVDKFGHDFLGSFSDVVVGSRAKTAVRDLDLLGPEQQKLMEQIAEFLGQPIGGQLSGTEAGSLAGLEEQALQATSGEGATGASGAFLEDILRRGPTDIDEFFDKTIRDPLLEDFQDIILPGIGKRFAGQFFGGERQEAERRGLGDLLKTLTRERSRVSLEGRRQDTETGLQAAATTTGREAELRQLLSTIFTAGGRGQQLEQGQIDNILALLGIKTKENVVTVTPASSGLLGSFLGGGGGAAVGAGVASMFSSEEFKTDKHEAEDVLGKIGDLRIERWKYNELFADDAEHIGPYAEEFHEAFGTPDDKTIPIIDVIGVSLKGIQELDAKVSAIEIMLGEL